MRCELTIVIVAYRCDELLAQCLDSLAPQIDAVGARVVVVDNGSSAPTAALVGHYAFATRVDPGANVGFARANNLVLAGVEEGDVLLLNPDTVVPDGALAAALAALHARPEVGVVGPKLVRPDGTLDHACKRGFPTPASSSAYFLRLDRLFPRSPRLGAYRASTLDPDAEGYVDAVNGAFMLVRGAALRAVGPLDEAFWMYGEDLDWCYRFHRAGWRVLYLPEPVTHVKWGSSSRFRDGRATWAFHRAMWLFYRKHHARAASAPVGALIFAAIHLKLTVALARNAVARRLL